MKGIKKGLAILLVLCTLLSMVVMTGAGVATGTKPADSSTQNQPFDSGTGGSANFRIPALVTLSDGTLVAAADARWNQTGDGWGLDTIVSRSTDNGANWNYTFANYLGDNGNAYNSDSTAFIDPALAVAGDDTIYMLVDLYPHGTYIGNVKAGTGFDSNGHLLLRTKSGSSYDYYVGDFTDGTAHIYKTDGTPVSGYTVDEYFNITGDNVSTNLFFSDSPYQVLGTSYLYLTKSTDGGNTWSAPTMLNSQVKNAGDMFYGVGPGGGIVTSTGRIIFPCYTYTTQDGNTSVIYSDDGGVNWTRSADMNAQTSEASISEVTLGGQNYLYMFTRHGGYFVSSNNGTTWSDQKSVSGISYTTSCELSTLTYSKTIDGRPAILLSAPTSSRTTGKIFVGLVQDNGSISWAYTYSVNGNNDYAYSDLAELSDGSIGLLYENASGSITYTNLAINEIAPNAQIGDSPAVETPDDSDVTATNTKDVTVYIGQSTTITDSTGNYQDSYTDSGLDTSIATADVKGTTVEGGTVKTLGSKVSMNSDGTYTGVISDGSGNYLVLNGTTISSTTNINEATEWTVTRSTSRGTTSYTIQSGSYYLSHSNNNNNLTASTSRSSWSYSSGFYYTSGRSSYYLCTNNGTWQLSTTNSSKGQLYSVTTTTTAPVDATDITITGVAVGTTSVVVGNTRYNITVKEMPDTVDLITTPFTSGTGQYSGEKVTKLTTSVNKSYDLNLNISGSSIVWSSADESVATVNQNGTITGVGPGETTVTCTVDGVPYTIPVVVVSDSYGGSYDYTCDIRISEITATTVRYSLNLSTNLLDAQEGEAIYLGYNYPFCINFFGVEDEGYALTYMSSTNSAGNYYSLYEVSALSELAAYTNGAIYNQRVATSYYNSSDVDTMLWYAINQGYHGTMGWTRAGSNGSIYSDLTFRSEKLPTVEKTIETVNGEPYTEGMTAKNGDVIVYDVTVTQYKTTEAITYSNVSLKDNLDGATFTTNNSTTVTPSLSNSTLTANRTYTYTVNYTITENDLDTDIINTVDLSYSYSGQYSEGNYGGSAKAEAKISAPTFAPYDIVIDFGLPVTIDYSGEDAHGRYNIESGTATYGDVTVENNVVTYTPNTVLKGMDTVTLTNDAGAKYTFNVYPATTVYYEEGFATPYAGKGIVPGSKGTGTQAAEAVGDKQNVYGYDPAYEGIIPSELANGTIELNAAGEGVSFEFTGTGVDIYTNSNTDTGTVMVYVYKGTGNTKQFKELISVDTAMRNGDTGATVGQAVTAYNVPIVSLSGLPYGDYTVEVDVVNSKVTSTDGTTTKKMLPVYVDGFRVHGTLDVVNTTAYQADGEANPTFVELRDSVLQVGLNATADTSKKYANQIAANVMSQVYAFDSNGVNALVINPTQTGANETTVQDLLDNGPKNEIYLRTGESLVFTVSAGSAQIGLKALDAATSYTINNGTVQKLSASTDMFYSIDPGTITITNNGAGILSITELKLFDAGTSTASVEPLSAPALTRALMSLGYEAEPVEATATLNITVQAGGETLTTTLTATGTEGERHTFTAAEIQAAVEALELPEGYTLDGVTFEDVTVTCGEASDVSFTAAESPAPTPVSPLQKIIQIAVKIIKKIVSWF